MATLSAEKGQDGMPNGCWRILFFDRAEKRHTIRPGRLPVKEARRLRDHVTSLEVAARTGTDPKPATLEWLNSIGDGLHRKLAKFGLCDSRTVAVPTPARETVRSYIDGFLARYGEKVKAGERKERTLWTMKNDADCLYRFLTEKLGNADMPIDEFMADDADAFRTWMLTEGYAEATAARRVVRCREFFRAAIRSKQLTENPFAETETGDQSNASRFHFVTCDETAKLLDACPSAEWRALVALGRYGALRTPSETLGLKWSDVDFVGNRITVYAPKTEGHKGKGKRVIPLFPELRLYLEEAFDPDNVYVVSCFNGDTRANIRTQLLRIIRKAGLEPWERITHNLRASRKNELVESFPAHVVSEWTGSSVQVDDAHYLHVRQSDFDAALKSGTQSGTLSNQSAPIVPNNGNRDVAKVAERRT